MYDLDMLYESGKIPERYYSQLNGKSGQENYRRFKMRKPKKDESIILSMIESLLYATAKVALDEILKELK